MTWDTERSGLSPAIGLRLDGLAAAREVASPLAPALRRLGEGDQAARCGHQSAYAGGERAPFLDGLPHQRTLPERAVVAQLPPDLALPPAVDATAAQGARVGGYHGVGHRQVVGGDRRGVAAVHGDRLA